MKSKYKILIALILLTVFVQCDNESSDDNDKSISDDDNDDNNDDDSDDDSDSQPYPGCEENSAPEFLSINVIVNGIPVEQPVTLSTTDTLAFSIEYYDAECNFKMDLNRRGSIEFRASDADVYTYGNAALILDNHYWLDGIGCSSEVDGPFVLNVDANDFAVPEDFNRLEPLRVFLTDACYVSSNSLSIDFTVHPAE